MTELGLYEIAALAAGATIQSASIGLEEPSFALVRPPGHHASPDFSWGYCFFNNIAIAIAKLKQEGKIRRAMVLDIDHHDGDGTINVLGVKGYTTILNPSEPDPGSYLAMVEEALSDDFDIIGVSAGFDSHKEDWGGVLSRRITERSGKWLREPAKEEVLGVLPSWKVDTIMKYWDKT